MQKRGIITLAVVFVLGVGGYAIAQQMRPGPYMGSQMMVESAGGRAAQAVPGPGIMGPGIMGQGMWGQAGSGMMGRGMMGSGMMGMMGRGMMGGGMRGFMTGSPEIVGAMMSLRGEMMSLMGQMMQKYGASMWQPTPDMRKQMQKEMLERTGEVFSGQGSALKKRADSVGK